MCLRVCFIGLICGLGDVIAQQCIEGCVPKGHDWKRSAKMAAIGFCFTVRVVVAVAVVVVVIVVHEETTNEHKYPVLFLVLFKLTLYSSIIRLVINNYVLNSYLRF